MKLHILNPGPQTTVQDRGRFGYMAYGIAPSGAMDQAAYEAANELLGNRNGEAVLEATLLGPTVQFDGDCPGVTEEIEQIVACENDEYRTLYRADNA